MRMTKRFSRSILPFTKAKDDLATVDPVDLSSLQQAVVSQGSLLGLHDRLLRDVMENFRSLSPNVTKIGDQVDCGSRRVAEYSVEFRTLAAGSGWNDEALQGVFRNGLSDMVKDELAASDDTDSLDSLISLATSRKIWKDARAALLRSADRNRRIAEHHRIPAPNYWPGQKVWLLSKDIPLKNEPKKLAPCYLGPFEIESVINPSVRETPPKLEKLPNVHQRLKSEISSSGERTQRCESGERRANKIEIGQNTSPWTVTLAPMSSFTFSCLGILAFLLQVCSGEGSQRCEGFDKDSYVFEVESLAVGQVLGRVHFNCNEQNGLEFQTDDPSFQVESDGRVLVSDVPSTNQTSFIIIAFSKAEDTWKTAVTVLINGNKLQVKGSAEDKSDVPVFMWPSRFSHSALRRRKRDRVIPVIKHPENDRGPFPKFLVQIKSDRQKETKVFYTITGPGADQSPVGIFSVNSNDGKISVHKPLDREERDKYKLLAHELDENGVQLEDAVDVVIEVIDMNDNKPQFVAPTFYGRVVEGAAPGTAFMNVTATDADEKDNSNSIIRYSIESQDPAGPNSQMFTISSTSGLISVLHAGLDREKVDKYTLIIQAADMEGKGLTTTATAIITVTDANDNAPKFVTSSITVEVPENEVDYDVSRHPVTDDDLPHTPAWKANFSITFGNERNQFTMITDPQNNGVLKIVKPLDFERSTRHVVIIEVRNEIPFVVTMPLSSATVTINVLDVNEAPEDQQAA
ncbi:cadherin-1-like [Mobula hypostoma]|uniref:cadherin-1-like n=1 Tax=Mobula hypostoma TaxID=723540 RepID=UPI002FC3041E